LADIKDTERDAEFRRRLDEEARAIASTSDPEPKRTLQFIAQGYSLRKGQSRRSQQG
jgi:hypothetical protein